MRKHGAFRLTCGTGREHDGEQVIGTHPANGRIKLVLAHRFAVIDERFQCTVLEVEYVAEAFDLLGDAFQSMGMVLVTAECDGRLHLRDDRVGLLLRIGLIDRNTHRTNAGTCEIQ